MRKLRTATTPSAGAQEAVQLSADGCWWWDGTRWAPALSPDGLWRWDGARWRPVTELDTADPAALVESLDRLVEDRFAEAGHVLILRAHEWRPPDAELADLVAQAAPMAARLSAIDAQFAGIDSSGGGLSLRQLLGGDERQHLESEARALESQLRPLAVLVGRMAPQPSLRDADEILAPARRLSERVVELTQALAEERLLAGEHVARVEDAQRRLAQARESRDAALRELEDRVRARETERAQAVQELERAVLRVRVPIPGAPLARFEGLVLHEDRVDTPDGRGPLVGAEAVVGTAAEMWDREREAVTRLGLLEARHAGRFFDALTNGADQEMYILVKTAHVRSVAPVPPGQEAAARDFATALSRAADGSDARTKRWEAQVNAAEAALRAAMADTSAVDEARAALEGAAANLELNRPVEGAEAELARVSDPPPELRKAAARLEAVAERLLDPPPPLVPAGPGAA